MKRTREDSLASRRDSVTTHSPSKRRFGGSASARLQKHASTQNALTHYASTHKSDDARRVGGQLLSDKKGGLSLSAVLPAAYNGTPLSGLSGHAGGVQPRSTYGKQLLLNKARASAGESSVLEAGHAANTKLKKRAKSLAKPSKDDDAAKSSEAEAAATGGADAKTSPTKTQTHDAVQLPPLVLVSTFATLPAAVMEASRLILSYCSLSSAERDAMCLKYAPLVHTPMLPNGTPAPHFRDAVHIVADIDDTVLLSDESFSEDQKAVPIVPVTQMMRELASHPTFGHRLFFHFVTARLRDEDDEERAAALREGSDDVSNKEWTLNDLKEVRTPPHSSLHLAPAYARESRPATSQWKFDVRRRIAQAAGAPIVMTIGDQASDLLRIEDDEDFERFDEFMSAEKTPFGIVRPGDGVCLWGFKLRARC